jgi:hypothetical protein
MGVLTVFIELLVIPAFGKPAKQGRNPVWQLTSNYRENQSRSLKAP